MALADSFVVLRQRVVAAVLALSANCLTYIAGQWPHLLGRVHFENKRSPGAAEFGPLEAMEGPPVQRLVTRAVEIVLAVSDLASEGVEAVLEVLVGGL